MRPLAKHSSLVCHRPGTFLPSPRRGASAVFAQRAETDRPSPSAGQASARGPRKLLLGERPLKLPEGDTLFERGDIGDGCYWLRRGVLAVYVASATGDQRILALLGQNAIVGELAMIDGLPRSASVRALRECELSFVSRAAFTDMLKRHPELYNDIVTTLAARLRQTDEDLAASSFQTVRSRVARALLQFAHHLGEEARPGRVTDPAPNHPERPCRHGGRGAREREPHIARVAAPEDPRGIVPRRPRRPQGQARGCGGGVTPFTAG